MTPPPAWRQWLSNSDPERVRGRFMGIVFCCLLLTSLPAMVLFHHYQLQTSEAMIRDQGYGVLANYITQTRDSIEKGQRKSFALVMDNIAQLEGVVATTLYDRDGLMNYRSGKVTVGIPFVRDSQGNLINPNEELYRQTRGMFLRDDWNLEDRSNSPSGRQHLRQVAGQPCADCHFQLDQGISFNDRGRAEALGSRTAHFYERIPVDSQCLVCHTNWRVGELAGVLGVSMDKGAFLSQAHENTRRLIYFLLLNAALILAVTFLVATMYRQILVTRQQLTEKSGRLSGLLDNSGQGFLSFGPDLRVEPEYSRECETLLGAELSGKPITELLCSANEPEAGRLGDNIRRIFETPDEFKRETLLSLLPGHFQLNDRELEVDYRLIGERLMMLVITDITEKLRLESQVAEEQTRLRLIVCAATESAELFEVLDDYRRFGQQELPRLLDAAAGDRESAINEIYRQVHTFKGLFGQLEFIHLPRSLHQLETELRQDQEKAGQTPDPREWQHQMQQADAALEQDLLILRETLGEAFFTRRGQLLLAAEEVEMLENLAERLLHGQGPSLDSEETQTMLRRLQRLRYVPFRNLLAGHAKAAQKLAERREKELAPIEIDDQDLLVAPEIYAPFSKSLVHLFRNAVDHGLETPEERWEQDKEEEGHLHCLVRQEGDEIILEISDDGRGLDAESIRRKAVELGRLSADQAAAAQPAELHLLIFDDQFTTKDQADELSGRGVGLAAVKAETERLGGRIEVTSTPGQGTTFRFRLPYLEKKPINITAEESDEQRQAQ
ncbi:ATP-binding protein [Desulfurivibrio alkaliphilus]|uniref:histidine kinase n=1 Tax=Desulfurivibrio alkaliphilus (strain DSM 19089 / UNIQEM U267 / AHT2) TaxID=589865 RepID=D6Z1C2_DESAT|nr:ATP-binding protein [Desulfurivibrio alkaliphilus]ADH85377.1 CheA signal transduction histidine kinase [Desulfurivibrio alkaliphilus AHT 2]